MRTTLDLPDPLFRTLKARAAMEGIPLKRVVQRMLEAGVAHAPAAAKTVARLPFPSISTGGLLVGPFSNAELVELTDEDLDPQGP